MQITRVELRNIKNHANAEWVFLPGLIAICGPNGSGKTTILEAIAWALFDQLDYKREDFVKRGEKKGQVAVGFISDLDQREYSVQRDTAGSYFVSDVVTKGRLAEQRSQVLPWLCQHIGVEPGTDLASLFRTTIGVPQGTFTRDFALRPAERKTLFDHTLKLDEYRDASDHLRLTVRYLESETTRTELAIAAAEGELKGYEKALGDLECASIRRQTLTSDFAAVEIDQANLTREALELDALSRNLEVQRSSSERLDVKVRLTRDKLASAREAADEARIASALVQAAQAGYEAYMSATKRLNDIDQKRAAGDKLRQELVGIERLQIATRTRIEHYRKLLDEAQAARKELSQIDVQVAEQTLLEARIASLRENRGARQSLERELHRVDLELGRMRKRYSDLAREYDNAVAQQELAHGAQKLEAERKEIESAIARQEFALQGLKVKREYLDRLAREMSNLMSSRDRVRRELDELESLTVMASQASLVADSHGQLTDQLARLRAEVERDSAMVLSLESGGICPLLTEKCLNLKPGESLDSRFREGLTSRRLEISKLEAAALKLAIDLKQAQEASAHVARVPHLQSDLARGEEAIAEQLKHMQRVESEIADASRDHGAGLATARSRRAKLEDELIAARAAERLYKSAVSLKAEVEAIKEQGRLMRDEREETAARLRDIVDVDSALKEAEDRLAALSNPRARADAIKHQLARTDQWKAVVEIAEVEAAKIALDIGELSGKLEGHSALEDELIDVKARRVATEADYRAFIANEQAALTAERRAQEVAAVASETEQTEEALRQVLAEHERLAELYDPQRHNQVRVEVETIRRRATQLATQLEHANEETARLEAQISRLEEVRAHLHSQVAKRARFVQLTETADFIRTTLLQAAPYITEAYLFSISHEGNQLYREITGRHDVTLRWSREYEITLEEDGRERPFSSLSGGEQMAAALAIRLALLRELSEIGLAFFDEPTANLDEERRANLAQQIGRIKHFKQLFVVSHDDSFEAYTDQVIMLSDRQASSSGLS